ncbi:hypothetical protein [Pseudomonas putida]|uniref:hypothetical protein n=1 Tax=Pseudomonas putida TaxID=303 RepID=UPI003570B966
MKKILIAALLFLSVGSAAAEGAMKVDLGGGHALLYENELGGRYQALALISNGKVLRKLHGVADKGGLFEYERSPVISSDGRYAVVNQVESESDERGSNSHEVAYCELIDLMSGCIVARDTGQFCGGEFTDSGEWRTFVFQDLNLLEATPAAEKYVSGRLFFSDSPGDSLGNLLVCDPLGEENVKYYKRLADEKLSNLSDGARSKLRDVLRLNGHWSNTEK